MHQLVRHPHPKSLSSRKFSQTFHGPQVPQKLDWVFFLTNFTSNARVGEIGSSLRLEFQFCALASDSDNQSHPSRQERSVWKIVVPHVKCYHPTRLFHWGLSGIEPKCPLNNRWIIDAASLGHSTADCWRDASALPHSGSKRWPLRGSGEMGISQVRKRETSAS